MQASTIYFKQSQTIQMCIQVVSNNLRNKRKGTKQICLESSENAELAEAEEQRRQFSSGAAGAETSAAASSFLLSSSSSADDDGGGGVDDAAAAT